MAKRPTVAKALMESLEPRVLLSASKAGPAAEVAFIKQPTSASQLGTISVAIEDAQGHIVKTDKSKVSLTIQSGPSGATLSGTVVVFAKKGIATFNAVGLNPAGTYTLSASDGSLSPAVSQAFTINSSATRLVITTQPKAIVAGAAETVRIALENSAGVIQTTDNSNVTIKIASGPKGSQAQGTLTVAAVKGVATFSSVVLPKAGSYTLIATSGTLKSSPTSAFTVSAGAAAQVRIISTTASTKSAPVKNTTGLVGPVVVHVVDAEGNLVTTDTSTVTLILNTTLSTETTIGQVTQAETATAAAVGGVATFNALTTLKSGYYNLFVQEIGLGGDSQLYYVR